MPPPVAPCVQCARPPPPPCRRRCRTSSRKRTSRGYSNVSLPRCVQLHSSLDAWMPPLNTATTCALLHAGVRGCGVIQREWAVVHVGGSSPPPVIFSAPLLLRKKTLGSDRIRGEIPAVGEQQGRGCAEQTCADARRVRGVPCGHGLGAQNTHVVSSRRSRILTVFTPSRAPIHTVHRAGSFARRRSGCQKCRRPRCPAGNA